MPEVRPATPEMFEAIYPLLAEHNPALPKEKWRLLVDYPWRSKGDDLGYVLVERGEIVGFLSTLYSRRLIDGKEVRLCNTAHWVVREDFRADSLRLFLIVLRQRDCTITNLTSSATVAAMMPKLRFKLLEENLQLLFPVPVLPKLAGRNGSAITSEPSAIVATLDAADLRIFEDHAGCECGHVVVRARDDYCYVVFSGKSRRVYGVDVPYCHIHYISNRDLFLRHLSRIKWYFLRTHGAWFVAVDERFVGQGVGMFSKAHRLGTPRYYRSEMLAADQVDNLYTELVLGL
jgi:hypothetical protein